MQRWCSNRRNSSRLSGSATSLLRFAGGTREPRLYCCLDWVGPAPLSAGPPSEPDVRLSPHPAQARPSGSDQREAIRSAAGMRAVVRSPLTAAGAAASSLSVGSGLIVVFPLGSPDHVSAISGPGTGARYPAVIHDGQLEGLALLSRFPAVFRPPAFGFLVILSRQGVQRSSRSAYQNQGSGPRRGFRVSHA